MSYYYDRYTYYDDFPTTYSVSSAYMYEDGMITDQQYISFPLDGEYKKYDLQPRLKNNINREKSLRKPKDPIETLFLSLIENLVLEQQIEQLRIQICSQKDFNIPTIYRLIDQNRSNNLTCAEFTNGLARFGLNYSIESMRLIYYRFSKTDTREIMTINHFARLFVPLSITNQSVMSRQIIQPGQKTVKLLGDILTLYRQQETTFEGLRQRLKGLDFIEVYNSIDQNNTKSIGLGEFQAVLNRYSSRKLTSVDALLIFSRFDKSGDGTISPLEFRHEMQSRM